MHKIRFIPAVILIASFSFGQSKNEMPFTTASPEANKLLRGALVAYGDANIEAGNKLTKESLLKDPDFGMAYLLSFSNDPEVLKQNMAKAEGSKLSADEKLFLSGVKARRENKPTQEFLGPLLAKYPKDNYLHLLAMLNSDTKNSVGIGEGLVKRSPKFAPGYNILGYAYMDQNEMSKAENCFDKYIALRPDLANVYDSKGDYMMRAGNFKEAITLFEKATSMGQTGSANKARRASVRMKNPKLSEKDVEEIKTIIGSTVEALKKGDVDAYMSFQADQANEIFSNQMSNIGAGNIRARLKDNFKNGSYTKFESSIKSVEGLGPIALAWGKFEWAYQPNQSKTANEIKRNAVFIFRRQDDGKWRILSYILSMPPQDESADDIANIRKVFARWNAAVNPGEVFQEMNVDAFAEQYSAQAVEVFSDGRSNVGLDNLKARWSGSVGAKWQINSLGSIGVEVVGRRAVAWGAAIETWLPKGADQVTNFDFPWVMVLTKEKDDQWRILAIHWSAN